MDRPIAAGIDLYKTLTDYQQADYEGDQTSFGFRLGFPVSEFGSVGLRYTLRFDQIQPFYGAPTVIQEAAGNATTSAFGYSYAYNTLDDPIKPTRGLTFNFSQDFAGFGGNVNYIKTNATFSYHHPLFWDSMIAKFTLNGGYAQGYAGRDIRLEDRFFEGGDLFRGFALAGVGPREISASGANALGGNAYLVSQSEVRLPDFLPAEYGVGLSLFTDVGTLGHLEDAVRVNSDCAIPGAICIKDDMALRASAGVAISWKSPFGPIAISLGLPYVKQSYDKSQIIYFSAASGL